MRLEYDGYCTGTLRTFPLNFDSLSKDKSDTDVEQTETKTEFEGKPKNSSARTRKGRLKSPKLPGPHLQCSTLLLAINV